MDMDFFFKFAEAFFFHFLNHKQNLKSFNHKQTLKSSNVKQTFKTFKLKQCFNISKVDHNAYDVM